MNTKFSLIFLLVCFPSISFATVYQCTGEGKLVTSWSVKDLSGTVAIDSQKNTMFYSLHSASGPSQTPYDTPSPLPFRKYFSSDTGEFQYFYAYHASPYTGDPEAEDDEYQISALHEGKIEIAHCYGHLSADFNCVENDRFYLQCKTEADILLK